MRARSCSPPSDALARRSRSARLAGSLASHEPGRPDAAHRRHSIELTVDVDAPEATVWDALVHDEHRHRWWSYLDLDARPGGRLLERWHDRQGRERMTSGEVLEVRPSRLLHRTWRDDDGPAATEVEFALQADDDASLLRVRHCGWERLRALADELRPAHAQGWRMHLDNLKRYVEGSAG